MKALVKLCLTLVLAAVFATPTWIFLITRPVIAPEGFWQNLVLAGLGVYVLGGVQVVLLIVLLATLIKLWLGDEYDGF